MMDSSIKERMICMYAYENHIISYTYIVSDKCTYCMLLLIKSIALNVTMDAIQ